MDKKKSQNHVLVLGLGISGRSAATFLIKKKHLVTGLDRNAAELENHTDIVALRQEGMEFFSDTHPVDVERFSYVVLSPGIASTHPVCLEAIHKGVEVIGEIELACRHLTQPVLGITGTNGKTTVSLLIGHVLNHAGIKAKVVGNVGIPLSSELIDDSSDIFVCELSSYQLETLKSKVLDAAVILNITPDHLDRYSSMQEYAKAKIRIGECIKEGGSYYIAQKIYEDYFSLFESKKPKTMGFHNNCDISCDQKTIFVKENIELILPDRYRGKASHDVENIMAAFALCREWGVSSNVFLEALESFKKPSHRIEFVRELHGVCFYNDSKGTNLDAVARAVESLPGKIVLIAGGVAKGCSFNTWVQAFGEKVKYICAIGAAKAKLIEDLSANYPVDPCDTLQSAVKKAFNIAQAGESVLLSPGCASYDMFKNFEHRGDHFKEIVQALKG